VSLFQTSNLRVERVNNTALLTLDVADRSVNVFNRQVLADLDAALDQVAASADLRLLVIRSSKESGFLAGADLQEFAAVGNAQDAVALSELGQRLFDKLANLRVPSVAILHGVCLGGGLELALACDYRLVLDLPGVQIGLPEIKLGLLPGWGGTQRLPRVVGLERALYVILQGRQLDAALAHRWGLADRKVTVVTAQPPPGLLCEWAEGAAWQGKRQRKKLPLLTWRQKLLESTWFGRRLILSGAARILRRRTPDDMPAPGEALEAVRTGIKKGMAAGLAQERQAIGRLATTTACRNLIGVFFQHDQARKLPEGARELGNRVKRVGIVGAGTMGAGIAQLAALRGCEVIVQEVNELALGAGLLNIASLFNKAVERRVLTREEADRRLAHVRGTIKYEGFDSVDLVVEAAVERLEAKQAIFKELDRRTRPGAVLATNTSSLPVGKLQEGLTHPERIAGLHFFNPVHKMELVEVARTATTDPRAIELLTAWSVRLGKMPVVVQDSPGFVVNRILMPYLYEALLLVAEGMKIHRIDQVMHRFGMGGPRPMGPLELLDQVGLDVAAHIAREMRPVFGTRFAVGNSGLNTDAFEQLCRQGWLGQKKGIGFYRYRGNRQRVNKLAANLLREGRQGQGPSLLASLPAAVRQVQARERLVLSMVNEAAACLEEGLAEDAATIDLAMVYGTGWAPHRGGPLRYARDRGFAEVVRKLTELARTHGRRFEPCAELRRWAEQSEASNAAYGLA
jgi:3-hydroxyacyl-CoA dehydrogenase/enoyl-CoA hydratase/3-hydroxybutyryl-CoA epimerase